MRGKETGKTRRVQWPGITPAYAGKSYTRTCYAYNVWDHPRVCGEKGLLITGKGLFVGSPPRMRGKVPNTCVTTTCCGITPAYAGKSGPAQAPHTAGRDHPRVCGEKHEPPCAQGLTVGSPPRMRGKGSYTQMAFAGPGITPAYAGKSGTTRRKAGNKWDHPRVCGEKGFLSTRRNLPSGSPPRMRGKESEP